jgi:Beta-propeller repeat
MERRGMCSARGGLWLPVCLFFVGCHSDPLVTEVGVTADKTALFPGQSANLTASVVGSGQFANTVTWSIDGGGSGLVVQGMSATYTAPSVSVTTTVVVRATSSADSSVSGTVTLTVSMMPISLTLSPDTSRLYSLQAININGSVSGPAAGNDGVSWSIVSGGGTLSTTTGSDVTYTAPAVTSETLVVIRAVPAADTTQHTDLTLTIDHGWPQVVESTPDSAQNAPQDTAAGVAVDSTSLAVYVAGNTNSGHFDVPGSLGEQDGFVAKFDAYGNLLWVHQFGTEVTDTVTGLVADASGNVYVGGYTSGLSWTPGPPGPTGAITAGFLLAYDTNGNFKWRQDIGPFAVPSAVQCAVFGVTIDTSSNIYAAGSCANTPTGVVLRCTAAGCDGPGTLLTLVTPSTTPPLALPFFTAIAVDARGAYDLVGSTNGGLQGGSGTPVGFVTQVQANTSSTPVWVQTLAPTDPGQSLNLLTVAIDSGNNVYAGGYTNGALAGQTSQGGADAVLALYDSQGHPQWALQFGTVADEFVSGLVFDPFTSPNLILATGTVNSGGATQSAFLDFYNFQGDVVSPGVTFDGPDVTANGGGVTVADPAGNLFIGYTTGAQLGGPTVLGLHAGVQKLNALGNPLPL